MKPIGSVRPWGGRTWAMKRSLQQPCVLPRHCPPAGGPFLSRNENESLRGPPSAAFRVQTAGWCSQSRSWWVALGGGDGALLGWPGTQGGCPAGSPARPPGADPPRLQLQQPRALRAAMAAKQKPEQARVDVLGKWPLQSLIYNSYLTTYQSACDRQHVGRGQTGRRHLRPDTRAHGRAPHPGGGWLPLGRDVVCIGAGCEWTCCGSLMTLSCPHALFETSTSSENATEQKRLCHRQRLPGQTSVRESCPLQSGTDVTDSALLWRGGGDPVPNTAAPPPYPSPAWL